MMIKNLSALTRFSSPVTMKAIAFAIKNLILLLGLGSISTWSSAAILTSTITDLPESSGSYYWGDGKNFLYQEWSTNTLHPEGQGKNYGWFYSAATPWSNVDVYVYSDFTDVLSIGDASQFSYITSGAILAGEGDTVFFRGDNGFYGAWVIDDIYLNPQGDVFPFTYLTGSWYFQDNGTPSFSEVPVPAAFWLFAPAIIGMGVTKRRRTATTPVPTLFPEAE